MYCIVGLGNHGSEYAQTRHNVGFLVVDEFAAVTGVSFRPGKGDYWFAHCSLNNVEVAVLKPATFMNNSGIAVQEFLEQQKIPLDSLLVVCDDFQLPLGTIRLRQNGTDGGHNGLSSVIYHLQTDQFARLRCGIASAMMPAEKSKMKDFVLEQFSESELPNVKLMVERARDACLSYIKDDRDRATN
ncbi:MAG: aminoacyl-tRNA hydrolase [Bacteroidota bacterium]|jgi:PTH1 family peptidyl-tRNA hydrolase